MHVQRLGDGDGRRRWCLTLAKGEDVMERLERFAGDHGVEAAHFTAIGALRTATLAYFDWDSKEYDEIPVEEQVEVASLTGNVGRDEDDGVVLHIHCVLGRPDGTAVAGHLLGGTVRPTLEVFLHEGDGTLRRRPDTESGLDLIRA